jgi:TonB family protein
LEERLRQSPDDLEARATLLNYYFMNAQQARRVPHILWLIEHHPDAMVLLMAPGKITPFRAPFDDQVAYERAKRLWFEQAERHAGNAQVLMNAAMALEDSDPERAEQWLLQARQIQPAEQQGALLLAQLYVRYISAALPYANTAFAAHARDQLERTNDSALAGLAGGSLMQTEPELGGRLLQRARSLDPENYRWTKQVEEFEKIRREAQPAADRPTQPVKVRVSEAVQAAKLREQVSPIYPALARQARIQGDVVMNLTVAADGKVSNIELVSGHPLLIPAAQEAVRQWIYEPTYLNGSAIEVRVTVRVPFRL